MAGDRCRKPAPFSPTAGSRMAEADRYRNAAGSGGGGCRLVRHVAQQIWPMQEWTSPTASARFAVAPPAAEPEHLSTEFK